MFFITFAAAMDKDIINLRHISKSFGDNKVLDDISLNVRKGEFVTFLGPSGCGKTTLLRILAGFEAPDSGIVELDGSDISALPTGAR